MQEQNKTKMYIIYRYETKNSQPVMVFGSNSFSLAKRAYLDMIEENEKTERVIVMYCSGKAINIYYSDCPPKKLVIRSN